MTAVILAVLALAVVVGTVAMTARHRRPTSIEAGIHDFRRERDALAPEGEPSAAQRTEPDSRRRPPG